MDFTNIDYLYKEKYLEAIGDTDLLVEHDPSTKTSRLVDFITNSYISFSIESYVMDTENKLLVYKADWAELIIVIDVRTRRNIWSRLWIHRIIGLDSEGNLYVLNSLWNRELVQLNSNYAIASDQVVSPIIATASIGFKELNI